MTAATRIAVFVSGRGSNLQSLLDHFNAAHSSIARVALVVGSGSRIDALERARAAGVPYLVVDPSLSMEDQGAALVEALAEAGIGLVVLAGYVRLVPAEVVRRFDGRMLNIHPALLPSFGGPGMYGMRVHQAVLASGARVSGASVHLVTEKYDEGRIVAQWPVPVFAGDSPEVLAARVLKVEHLLLPAAVELVLRSTADDLRGLEGAFELTDSAAPPDAMVHDFLTPRREV